MSPTGRVNEVFNILDQEQIHRLFGGKNDPFLSGRYSFGKFGRPN